MQKYEVIQKLSPIEFRRLTGVRKETFVQMISIVKEAEKQRMSLGGKPSRLAVEDKLLMALEYLREYRTYFHLGQSYGLSESACYRNCKWIEDILIKSKVFSLPGKKTLLNSDTEFEVILIDATESPIERPKKRIRCKKRIRNRNNKQKRYYSGKKKRHTLKSQVVVDKKSSLIICTNFCNGKKHDFKLFKDSKVRWVQKIQGIVDSGYVGIKNLQNTSLLPKKRSRGKALTRHEKQKNRDISSKRALNENVIGRLKRFKILSDSYRNRRKRFGLRFNLIAGIQNWELKYDNRHFSGSETNSFRP